MFILVAQYYLLEKPTTEIYVGMKGSREMVAYSIADDVADELGLEVTRNGHVTVVESVPNFDMATELSRWSSFLVIYENVTKHNASLELTNYTKISSAVWLAGKDSEYKHEGDIFTLNHSGDYLVLNITIASVANANCNLDGAGSVYTRVIVNGYDSEDTANNNYTSAGTSYSCFVNFTNTTNMTVDIDTNNDVRVEYTNAPSSFTQRVSFNGSEMYVVFDKYNVSTGANPGWTESFNGTKKYATVAGMNFVVADLDNDTNYDYAFVDVGADGFFNSVNDRWYVKEGIVALNEKVFYMRFDLAGNWIMLYNALGTGSLSSWKGVVV